MMDFEKDGTFYTVLIIKNKVKVETYQKMTKDSERKSEIEKRALEAPERDAILNEMARIEEALGSHAKKADLIRYKDLKAKLKSASKSAMQAMLSEQEKERLEANRIAFEERERKRRISESAEILITWLTARVANENSLEKRFGSGYKVDYINVDALIAPVSRERRNEIAVEQLVNLANKHPHVDCELGELDLETAKKKLEEDEAFARLLSLL